VTKTNKMERDMKQETRQRRGRPHQWLQVAMLMLVMLLGGNQSAWAGGSWDKTNSDKGGGTYRFNGEFNNSSDNYSGYGYFETTQCFDLDKNQF